MKKVCARIAVCLLLAAFAWFGSLLSDRQRLREELIRIHVVADSDSPEDQQVKLSVRDAVIESMQTELKNITDVEKAKTYLQESLPHIHKVARRTLEELGYEDSVAVTFREESFDTKWNDFCRLPAGIYHTLRITIGTGQGENWWGIVFPEAVGLISEDYVQTSSLSGWSDARKKEIEIRFYFLDVMGKLENIFCRG